MKAIEVLTREHELVFFLLRRLECLLDDARTDDRLDASATAEVLEVIERFSDGCHQDKEETVLFPVLLRRVPGSQRGVIADLLAEHRDERELLDGMRSNLEGAAYGESFSLDLFVVLGRAYVAAQREHAGQEAAVLFPLAEEFLDEDDDAAMVEAFERVESAHFGPAGLDAQTLARRLGHPGADLDRRFRKS